MVTACPSDMLYMWPRKPVCMSLRVVLRIFCKSSAPQRLPSPYQHAQNQHDGYTTGEAC